MSTNDSASTAIDKPRASADADGDVPYLVVRDLHKTYGTGGQPSAGPALAHIDLSLRRGEFLAVVGPSGCGKSTLLQIIAGLLAPTRGDVSFAGARVAGPPAGVVYLFQQYAKSLYPWRTALENVAFAIERREGRKRSRDEARRYLTMVGLEAFADRHPWQLSGGMQQRVAIARALAARPQVLLMDEPFSAVDALTRMELQALMLELWTRERFTAMLVTHDVDEAVFLADRVAVLSRRPTVVARTIETGLERPRDPIETRESARFLALRHELLEMLLERPHRA